jgi:hypothetical protein
MGKWSYSSNILHQVVICRNGKHIHGLSGIWIFPLLILKTDIFFDCYSCGIYRESGREGVLSWGPQSLLPSPYIRTTFSALRLFFFPEDGGNISSWTSVTTQQITRNHISEDSNLNSLRSESLKSQRYLHAPSPLPSTPAFSPLSPYFVSSPRHALVPAWRNCLPVNFRSGSQYVFKRQLNQDSVLKAHLLLSTYLSGFIAFNHV